MRLEDRVVVRSVPLDNLSMAAAVERIISLAKRGRFAQVATVNLDFMVHSDRDAEVRTVLSENELNLPDGWPVALAMSVLSGKRAERVAGADLVPLLIVRAAEENLSVFLLGGQDGAAQRSASVLLRRHSGLRVTSYEPPVSSLDEIDSESIIERISQAEADIVLVAFGHPKQEKWIHRHRGALPMVAVGVGSCLDLIGGQQSRAPEWMQAAGMEWAFRLWNEPRRLALRYGSDIVWLARRLAPWVLARRLGLGRGRQ